MAEAGGALYLRAGQAEKLRHIPDVIEKARGTKEQAEAILDEAQMRADQIIQEAWRSARPSRKLNGRGRETARGDSRDTEGREMAGPERPR